LELGWSFEYFPEYFNFHHTRLAPVARRITACSGFSFSSGELSLKFRELRLSLNVFVGAWEFVSIIEFYFGFEDVF
jgi:hypothetical protein